MEASASVLRSWSLSSKPPQFWTTWGLNQPLNTTGKRALILSFRIISRTKRKTELMIAEKQVSKYLGSSETSWDVTSSTVAKMGIQDLMQKKHPIAFPCDILSGICFNIWYHLLWHSFWDSTWHTFQHSFWHIFWHSIWHTCWHSSGVLSGVLSGTSFWHSFWRLRSGSAHCYWELGRKEEKEKGRRREGEEKEKRRRRGKELV